jgi:hypothetical protein
LKLSSKKGGREWRRSERGDGGGGERGREEGKGSKECTFVVAF